MGKEVVDVTMATVETPVRSAALDFIMTAPVVWVGVGGGGGVCVVCGWGSVCCVGG